MPDAPQHAPKAAESPAKWVSVAAASRVFGISDRTLKRRVAVGAVPSKLENGRRLVAVPNGPIVPQNGTVGPGTEGQKAGTTRDNEREFGPIVTGTEGHLAQGQAGPEGTNGVALLIEQRDRDRAEIAFLRATIEQHQRSEAELRQSLREALRAMPKQLTAGTVAGAADSAPEPAKRAASRADKQTPVARSNGSGKAPESSGAGLSYGDIADWLEDLER